jgi:hypothetical protein
MFVSSFTVLLIILGVDAFPQQSLEPTLTGPPKSSGSGLGGLIGGIAQSVVGGTSNVPFGPAPKGCSEYEVLVGEFSKGRLSNTLA